MLSEGNRQIMHCKLLYLIGELHTGGAERQLYYLLRAMDREKFQPAVVVWNFHENDCHVAEIRKLKVPVYALAAKSSVAKLFEFRSLVRKIKPSIVHSYSFYTNFAAEWACQRLATIPIGSLRSDFVWAQAESGAIVGRLSARWPEVQVCNSYSAADSIRSTKSMFRPKRVAVVHNRLDLTRFIGRDMPKDTDPKMVGIGYLLPVKRWDRVISACHVIAQRGREFSLLIAGDGPLQEALEQQCEQLGIQNRIKFLGHVTNIPELLASASFVIHTAESEGCPNSVMEAMASARPVIATDVGDVSRLISHGETGFVVSRESQEELVRHIDLLLTQSCLCESMGLAARAAAENRFGLDRLATETLDTYRSFGWKDY